LRTIDRDLGGNLQAILIRGCDIDPRHGGIL
jgi:hypothetical protein